VIDWTRYLEESNCRSGATSTAIAEAEKELGLELPREYAEWLKFSNGYEGWIGKRRSGYGRLWRVEELRSLNDEYGVRNWAPGALLFGSDGGGEAFAFDTRTPQQRIVLIPFIGMEWKVALPLGDTFSTFLDLGGRPLQWGP
jgi:hypothetical protein